jgi:glutamate decarboxylase
MKDDVEKAIFGLFAQADAWLSPTHTLAAQVAGDLARFLGAHGRTGSPPLDAAVADFEDTRIHEEPQSPEAYLGYLLREIVPKAVKTSSPQFIGHMTSALPGYVFAMSQLLAVLNQNIVKVETSGVLTLYERQALAILHRLVFVESEAFYALHTQRNDSTLGMMVSGGTLANLAALWCARNAALAPAGSLAGVDDAGLKSALAARGYGRAVMMGSTLMHFSAEKAADILGLGEEGILRIPVDRSGRVDPRRVQRELESCKARGDCVVALIGLAGSTEVGSIDPLGDLAELAREYGVHLHVDAAWGGPVLFSDRHRHKLRGIDKADSVTIDGHKQLYLPVGLGTVLFRDPELARGIEKVANYVARPPSRDLGKRTLEGSRPALSLYVHAALAIMGRRGFEWLIDQGIDKTHYFRESVSRRPELELLAEPELNILVYRYVPARERPRLGRTGDQGPDNELINGVNRRLQEQQFSEGMGFVSRTLLSNTRYGAGVPVVALRAVLANPMTTPAHIDAVLEEQLRLGAKIETAL